LYALLRSVFACLLIRFMRLLNFLSIQNFTLMGRKAAWILALQAVSLTVFAQQLPPLAFPSTEPAPGVPAKGASPVQITTTPGVISANQVEAIAVEVKGFTFTGNVTYPAEKLQVLIADEINKAHNLASLDRVAERVTQFYRTEGFSVARAYLPPQQSADGTIRIAIVEGRYDHIVLKNNSSITDDFLRKIVARNLCETPSLSEREDACRDRRVRDKGLERSVLLLKDLQGITATAAMGPGERIGTSNLEITATDVRKQLYSLSADNYGSSSTGKIRFNGSAEYYNLRHTGDTLTLGVSTTGKGSNTGSIGYSEALGYTGLRVGVAFARGHYRLGGGFDATLSHGTSNTLSAYASYPLVRGVNRSLYARASVEARGLYDSVDVSGLHYKKNAHAFRAGLNGDHLDGWGGGGYNNYGMMFTSGYLGGQESVTASLGHFDKVTFNYARQQVLTGPMTLYAGLYGQHTSKNLDGSEQIGIGGPTAVRGYAGEAGGGVGVVGTLEVRYTTPFVIKNDPASLTYSAFLDRGWVSTYQTITATTPELKRSLGGYGVGITLQQSIQYFVRATYARHPSSQPSLVSPDKNGEFWLNAGFTFQ
jgi:hemolysin activation/secretion protein